MSLVDLSNKTPPAHVSPKLLAVAARLRRYAADIEAGKTAAAAVMAVDYNPDSPANPLIYHAYGGDEYKHVLASAAHMLAQKLTSVLIDED